MELIRLYGQLCFRFRPLLLEKISNEAVEHFMSRFFQEVCFFFYFFSIFYVFVYLFFIFLLVYFCLFLFIYFFFNFCLFNIIFFLGQENGYKHSRASSFPCCWFFFSYSLSFLFLSFLTHKNKQKKQKKTKKNKKKTKTNKKTKKVEGKKEMKSVSVPRSVGLGAVRFFPSFLSEDGALSPEMKYEVDDLNSRLNFISYYQIYYYIIVVLLIFFQITE